MKVKKNGHEFTAVRGDRFWDAVTDGTWEPSTYNIFDKLLTKDMNYLDLGAWIGPTVLYASKLCKRCWALEPDPVAYADLCANLTANPDIQNVEVFNEAILDHDGTVTLGSEQLGNSMTRVSHSGNAFQAPCSTLRNFVSRHGINDPLFIKMDVEGSEELILKSIDFFAEQKPILYVSVHYDWFPAEGLETVRKVGRLYKHCYDENLSPVNIEGKHPGLVFTD